MEVQSEPNIQIINNFFLIQIRKCQILKITHFTAPDGGHDGNEFGDSGRKEFRIWKTGL